MKALFLVFAALIAPQFAFADGVPLTNGRYSGRVIDFKLTKQQKSVIDHYRTCQLEHSETMNIYTPYVFMLTHSQTKEVVKIAGFAPMRLQIYETMRGFNDAGPHWNLALRYSTDRIEIPVNLLLREKEAAGWHNEQGWKLKNPCFPTLRQK